MFLILGLIYYMNTQSHEDEAKGLRPYIVAGIAIVCVGLAVAAFIWWRRKRMVLGEREIIRDRKINIYRHRRVRRERHQAEKDSRPTTVKRRRREEDDSDVGNSGGAGSQTSQQKTNVVVPYPYPFK